MLWCLSERAVVADVPAKLCQWNEDLAGVGCDIAEAVVAQCRRTICQRFSVVDLRQGKRVFMRQHLVVS